MENYRINILSVGVQMVSPSELVVHTVDGPGLGLAGTLSLPVGHLGHVPGWGQGAHHVTTGIVTGQIRLLLLSFPSTTTIEKGNYIDLRPH